MRTSYRPIVFLTNPYQYDWYHYPTINRASGWVIIIVPLKWMLHFNLADQSLTKSWQKRHWLPIQGSNHSALYATVLQVAVHWFHTVVKGVHCGEPYLVLNSYREVTGHYFNDTSMYTCHTGFVRNGDETSICQADGHWSVPPECQGKCSHSLEQVRSTCTFSSLPSWHRQLCNCSPKALIYLESNNTRTDNVPVCIAEVI